MFNIVGAVLKLEAGWASVIVATELLGSRTTAAKKELPSNCRREECLRV
jgi:hypothetical protein